MKRRVLGLLHALVATAAIYGMVAILAALPARFDFLDPIGDALADFDPSDVVFSRLRDPEPAADTNIVLVNIGNLPRQGIAAQLEMLAAQQPAAIGLDAMLLAPHPDWQQDSALVRALRMAQSLNVPVVLASQLLKPTERTGTFDSIATPHPALARYCYNGYANMLAGQPGEPITVRDLTLRQFLTRGNRPDSLVLPFSLQIARHKWPQAVDNWVHNTSALTTPISYRRQARHYLRVPIAAFMAGDMPTWVQGKIVLLGYLGPDDNQTDLTDVFFTPLNPRYAGKALPDMYGLLIHANIISMVAGDDYMHHIPDEVCNLLGALLVWLNVWVFIGIKQRLDNWYDLLSKVLQIVQTLLLLIGLIVIYYRWGLRLEITVTTAVLLLAGDVLEVYLPIERYVVTLYQKIVSTSDKA